MRRRLPKPWNGRTCASCPSRPKISSIFGLDGHEAHVLPFHGFVPIKTEDQLDLQALHRVRDRLVARRTSVINQMRAFLQERGISFRKGPASLRRQMPEILENGRRKTEHAN